MANTSSYTGLSDVLLSDPEIAQLLSAEAQIAAMLQVEAALARACASADVIPATAADEISSVAAQITINPDELRKSVLENGVPVIALVQALRDAVSQESAQYVHRGATSQDIVDTAWLLQTREVLKVLTNRLDDLMILLANLAGDHRNTVMAARTRSQQATPTTFGLKIASWCLPLVRHRARLSELQERLLVVQLGGAAGTLAAFGDKGLAVVKAFAKELNLSAPEMPWHNQRDNVAELAGWLALVTGSLGKIGRDIILLSQSEISEVRTESGGGSSTMPQKNNPVAAETLVTLARLNASTLSAVHQAMLHEHERDGTSWQLEWLTVPQMLLTTGAALARASDLMSNLSVDKKHMLENLEASRGLILAEAATFALAKHMPKQEAQELVKAACAEVGRTGTNLFDILAKMTDKQVDWKRLQDPGAYLGASGDLIDRVIAAVKIKANDNF